MLPVLQQLGDAYMFTRDYWLQFLASIDAMKIDQSLVTSGAAVSSN